MCGQHTRLTNLGASGGLSCRRGTPALPQYLEAIMQKDNVDELLDYFDVSESAGMRRFFCKGCNKGWQLPVKSKYPGNYLKMLDHAMEHRQIRRGEDDL